MKKIVMGFWLWSSIAVIGEPVGIRGLYCGTRGTMLGTWASDVLIPDYFPPENMLLRLLFVNPFLFDLSICEDDFDRANLGASCSEHDRCYATLGATKEACDLDLYQGWMASCEERYADGSSDAELCLSACTNAVNLMYGGLQFKIGDFCPSEIAFERSQEAARAEAEL